MFRVLSDEESETVTRWKPPELADKKVVNTRQFARAQPAQSGADVKALLGSPELKAGRASSSVSQHERRFGGLAENSLNRSSNAIHAGDKLGNMSTVSPDLLQTSYDEGYAKGHAEGTAALQQQTVIELKALMDALGKASSERMDSELEQEVVALTLDIARLVIRRELTIDDTLISNIVSAGLDQLSIDPGCSIAVCLHPFDAITLRAHWQNDLQIQITDDPMLERGGCRIESGTSAVNAGVEDWLQLVAAQLGLGDGSACPTVEDNNLAEGQTVEAGTRKAG